MYLKIRITLVLLMSALIFCFLIKTREPDIEVMQLDSGIFDLGVTVIITKDTAIAIKYVRENLDPSVVSVDFDSRATTFGTVDGKSPIIWFYTIDDTFVVTHELLHATINILQWAGIKQNDSTEEIYAYQLQYLTKQFYARRSN